MNEREPRYFTEFRKHIDIKIESSINELALMIKDTIATKEDIKDMVVKDDIKDMVFKKDLENFATKKDLENFATKKDLENFATKKDFENFATKKDLEEFATKKDFDRFATKEDLEEFKDITNRIGLEMVTRSDIKPILEHIGRYEIRAMNVENILLQDHKPRITDLEREVYAMKQ